MYYNVHRWYQPGTGRYTRPEPLQISSNEYTYVDSRPSFFVDPQGLLALDPRSCDSRFHQMPPPADDKGGPGHNCCRRALERAVQQYNEFFSPGWRQRKPECYKRLSTAHLLNGWTKPRGSKSQLTPLDCMAAGHHGEVMGYDFGKGEPVCGTTSADGRTFFRQGVCDRSKCGLPFNTLFHERLHRCGAPGEQFGLFTDAALIAFYCARP